MPITYDFHYTTEIKRKNKKQSFVTLKQSMKKEANKKLLVLHEMKVCIVSFHRLRSVYSHFAGGCCIVVFRWANVFHLCACVCVCVYNNGISHVRVFCRRFGLF